MKIKVGVVGYDLIGKRVADAVALQADMSLQGVFDQHQRRQQVAAMKGYAIFDGALKKLASVCDVLVNCTDSPVQSASTVIHGPHVWQDAPLCFSAFSQAAAVLNQPLIKVASANSVAFARLLCALRDLGPIDRFYSTACLRAGHATDSRGGRVDALEPVFDEHEEDWEMKKLFGGQIPSFSVGRVLVPYTHSNLHMVKLDLASPINKDRLLGALNRSPRIAVARAADGFANTARVQEFYRDMGRTFFDRLQVFIWEESIIVDGRRLYVMLDVSPEAIAIPEIIDAIRTSRKRGISMTDSVNQTDAALGIQPCWPARDEHCVFEDVAVEE